MSKPKDDPRSYVGCDGTRVSVTHLRLVEKLYGRAKRRHKEAAQ